jgi:hypothetical protein
MNRISPHLKRSLWKTESCGGADAVEEPARRLEVTHNRTATTSVEGVRSQAISLPVDQIAKTVACSPSPDIAKSIAQITEAWRSGIGHTLELARLISAIRQRLGRGEWASIWKSGHMPFSKSKAEMLVVIGGRLNWISVQTFGRLPIGWSVLYQLARLDRRSFAELLEAGIIHPKLKLQEARNLLKSCGNRKSPSTRSDILQRRLRRFLDSIYRDVDDWLPKERKMVSVELARLLQRINGDTCSRESVLNGHSLAAATPP